MAKTTAPKKKAPTKKSKKVVSGSGISSYKRVNRKAILVIAAVFAIIGIVTLIRSFAAVPTQKLEAESFTYNVNPQYVVTPGKNLASMWWTDTGTKSVLLDRDYKKLIVNARGSSCYGAPHIQVKIDQAIVLDQYITATEFTEIPVNINVVGGSHTVEVSFLNDFGARATSSTPACDRNLFVDSLTFVGTNIIEPSTKVSDTLLTTITASGFEYGKFGKAYASDNGKLWSNGTISANATTTKDSTSTVFYLSADKCNGEPIVRASINGVVVMEGAIAEEKAAAYVIPRALPAGVQNIQLSLLNDAKTTTCDRNIYIQKVEFRGYIPPVQPPAQPTPPRTDPPATPTQACTTSNRKLIRFIDYESATSLTEPGKTWRSKQIPSAPGKNGTPQTDRLRIVRGAEVPGATSDGVCRPTAAMRVELRPYNNPANPTMTAYKSILPLDQVDGDISPVSSSTSYDGSSRNEVVGETEPNNVTRWYGYSLYVPADYSPDYTGKWLFITQFHDSHVTTLPPPLSLGIVGDKLQFIMRKEDKKSERKKMETPLTPGKWMRVEFGVKFATDNTGWIEMWINGKKVPAVSGQSLTGIPTQNIDTKGQPDPLYFKQGIYQKISWDKTHLLYFGPMKVGTERVDVVQ